MGKRDGWEEDDNGYPRHEDEDSTMDTLRTVMDITVSGVQQRFNR